MDFTPAEIVAIKLSLRVAIVATLVSLPFGIAVALILARGRFPGRTLLDGIVHLPLVLPPVVTGYLLAVLPIGVGFLIWMLNHEYMMILFREPTGRLMISMAALLQIMGFFVIRKIIHIEV